MGVFEFECLITASLEGNTSCLKTSFEGGKCTLGPLVRACVGSGWVLSCFHMGAGLDVL